MTSNTGTWTRALATDLGTLLQGSVSIDLDDRRRFARDLSPGRAGVPDAVVTAATAEDVLAVVRYATDRSLPLYPRGAGLSFTRGYISERSGGILLDLTRLTAVRHLDPDERFLVVEAGMTWKGVLDLVRPLGLRTPYWGPLVGAAATVGATVSQDSAWFGSARHGPIGESLLGLEVVTLGGEFLRTGGLARDPERPFFRYHGPDLTGLFIGDNGALGIKTAVALRLIQPPAEAGVVGFAFPDFTALAQAADVLTTDGLVADLFAADQARYRAMVQEDPDPLLWEAPWSLHAGLEARTPQRLQAEARRVREVCQRFGGEASGSRLVQAFRDAPFAHLSRVLLGPAGEVGLPVMGIISYDRAPALHEAVEAVLARHQGAMARLSMQHHFLAVGMENAIMLEYFLYWPGPLGPVHAEFGAPGQLAGRVAADGLVLEREALSSQVREELRDVMEANGCFHFQLGRFYRTGHTLDPVAFGALRRLKRLLDPTDVLNPGVLGL